MPGRRIFRRLPQRGVEAAIAALPMEVQLDEVVENLPVAVPDVEGQRSFVAAASETRRGVPDTVVQFNFERDFIVFEFADKQVAVAQRKGSVKRECGLLRRVVLRRFGGRFGGRVRDAEDAFEEKLDFVFNGGKRARFFVFPIPDPGGGAGIGGRRRGRVADAPPRFIPGYPLRWRRVRSPRPGRVRCPRRLRPRLLSRRSRFVLRRR